jgi:hypothetical protein
MSPFTCSCDSNIIFGAVFGGQVNCTGVGSGTIKTHHGKERAQMGSFHVVKVNTRPITLTTTDAPIKLERFYTKI